MVRSWTERLCRPVVCFLLTDPGPPQPPPGSKIAEVVARMAASEEEAAHWDEGRVKFKYPWSPPAPVLSLVSILRLVTSELNFRTLERREQDELQFGSHR